MRSLLLACLASTALAANAAEPPDLARFESRRIEMAIPIKVVLYASDSDTADRAAQAALDRFRALNDVLSDYDPKSELRRLCDTAGTGFATPVSDDLWRVLATSQQFSQQSNGAFDATVGPVVRLWRRARRRGQLPPPKMLQDARKLVDYRLLRLDADKQTVELARAEMRLDLGGIAKGYALDEARKVIEKHGIHRLLIDAGGDIILGHRPPGRQGWKIGVAPIDVNSGPSRYLWLSCCAVATSGDAWQFVEIEGRRYSHIVDPRTGLGLSDHSSVTVVAPDGITADALASAVSVLGPRKGIELVDKTPGAAALIVRAPDGKPKEHESKRWKQLRIETGPTE